MKQERFLAHWSDEDVLLDYKVFQEMTEPKIGEVVDYELMTEETLPDAIDSYRWWQTELEKEMELRNLPL